MKKYAAYILPVLGGCAILIGVLALLKAGNLPPFAEKRAEQTVPTRRETAEQSETMHSSATYRELMNRGDAFAQKGLESLALKTYAEASRKEPSKEEPYLAIAHIHLQSRDFERAQKNFNIAHELAPTSAEVAIGLVQTFLGLGETEMARDLVEKLPDEHQKVAYYRGIIAAYLDDRARAKEELERAKTRGESQEVAQRAEQFLAAYREFEATESGLESYRKTLIGKAFNDVGEPTLAVPLLLDAVTERSDYRDAWLQLGYAYLQKNNFQDAKDALDKAYLLDPEKVETVYLLGLAAFGLNELDGAIRYMEIALKNNFQPKIYVQQKLAELYIMRKRYEEATQLYETMLQADQTQIDYFSRPVWLYIEELQNPQAALTLAEKAHAKYPEEPMALSLLGWALAANNRWEEAKSVLEQALEKDPLLAAAYLNLGTVYEEEAFLEAAKANYKRAYELSPDDGVGKKAAEKFNALLQFSPTAS